MSEHDSNTEGLIAIVGLSARFAGSTDADAFWRNIRDGVECIRDLSDEELSAAGVDAKLLQNPSYVKRGGPLETVDQFDAGFFGFGPKDAAILDPQHRNFMECSWEALEHAGHPPSQFDGSVGVFAGCGMTGYFTFNLVTNPELVESTSLFLLRHTGNDRDFLPTTVSYKLNLRGPSIAIQTACSTSLVAVHFAIQSLLSEECDLALAGGVTIDIPHGHGYLYREGEILAADGHCRAFDSRGAGTVLSSGAGVVVLRRYDDAVADGDTIHAVIRGSAVNNDGSQKVGYLAPSVDGQAQVVAEALAVADVGPTSISYVETHGTGTAVGDPIEVAALTRAFRTRTDESGFCAIGSNKPTIGHTDTAAGVASLIKVVQSLRHRQIPPSINFERPNPAIDFDDSPFFVNKKLRDWEPREGVRRAGVSSLGVGGTNVHVIVEEAPRPSESDAAARPIQILPLSARTGTALDGASARLADALESGTDGTLADVAFTLQDGREAFDHRRILAVADASEAITLLRDGDRKRVVSGRSEGPAPSIVFQFPGGGAQYPDMARGLYEAEPVFREVMDECFGHLEGEGLPGLRALLYPDAPPTEASVLELARPENSLPAILSLEIALARLWMSWGIEPAAMTGHSMGEYAAAHLASVMSLKDALSIVTLRARLMQSPDNSGRMLSIPLPESEVEDLLGADFDLAVVNGPSLCVVSGSVEPIEALAAELKERDVECRPLRLAAAAHSRFLDPFLDLFREGISKVELHAPERPFISNLTGTWATAEDVQDPEYWVRHLRHTVRYSSGLATILADPNRILLEVGPGQTLSSVARQQELRPRAVVPSMRHPEEDASDHTHLLTAFGRLWVEGAEVDWSRLRGEDEHRQRIPLPTYCWDHQRYWVEPGQPRLGASGESNELAPIEDVADWFHRPAWLREELATRAGSGSRGEPERWIVFVDETGLGTSFAAALEARGDAVVQVRAGDTFHRLSEREYSLAPEAGLDGYAALIQDLAQEGGLPNRIAHFWLVTPDRRARAGSSFYHRAEAHGFYSLVFLAQALGAEDLPEPLHIGVVSNEMQRVAGDGLRDPEKALVLGPIKVIPQEMPGITCQSIDIALGADAADTDALVEGLLEDLAPERADAIVAYRDGKRWVERLERCPAPSPADGSELAPADGVYWITGGLGGLGRLVGRHLAERGRPTLVLLSRRELPGREQWPAWIETHGSTDPQAQVLSELLALEALGATVVVEAADVANPEDMRAVHERSLRRFGRIDGVFHAAGGADDGPIQTKTQASIEGVLSPKVHGTQLLYELLAGSDARFLLLFSSSSTRLGPAGQVDYVAANSFLNAFAEGAAQETGPRVLAVNWGVWRDVGSAVSAVERLGGGDDAGRPARAALLDRCIAHTDERSVFATRFEASQWILDEHRTRDGDALIPGTGYLAMARAAYEESVGTPGCEIRDAFFVSPLAVATDETVEARVRVQRGSAGSEFEIESRSLGGSEWQLHAQGTLAPLDAPVPTPLDIDAIRSRCPELQEAGEAGFLKTAQEAHLRFGPRWHCAQVLRFGEGEALAELQLDDDFAEDLHSEPLHPALLDIATGFAMKLIPGYCGANLYVPFNYPRVRVHAALPAAIVSHVRGASDNDADKDTARFDVTIADPEGRILVEVEGFTIRRLDGALAPRRANASTGGERSESGQSLNAAERLFQEAYALGIQPDKGREAIEHLLTHEPVPQVLVSSIEVDTLIRRFREAGKESQAASGGFERPELATDYVEPRDAVEHKLAEFWSELLGVDRVGIQDDFFELGGHSLIAVRLFSKVKKTWDLEYSLSVLFEAPTIERYAELLRGDLGLEFGDESGERKEPVKRHRYLVRLQEGNPQRPPFFLVAGMFGNVLNLRHVATHLGADQTVYAIQAKGLTGDDEPHRRFPEMASAYLEEVRAVQPEGPYFLGGFSGGGITAFEMAQQLRAAGQGTSALILLDSIRAQGPRVTSFDKLLLQWHRLRRKGMAYFMEWARNRIQWEREKRRPVDPRLPDLTPAERRSKVIEAAFREACAHYSEAPYPGPVTLFRPSLASSYELHPGRYLSDDRNWLAHDNRWGEVCSGSVVVNEVPGDHDRMVLEPHVRVLAAKIRVVIDEALASDRGGEGAAL